MRAEILVPGANDSQTRGADDIRNIPGLQTEVISSPHIIPLYLLHYRKQYFTDVENYIEWIVFGSAAVCLANIVNLKKIKT